MLRISFAPLNYTQDADQVVESYILVPLGCIRLKVCLPPFFLSLVFGLEVGQCVQSLTRTSE